jgi:transposase
LASSLYRIVGVDLTAIDGIDALTAHAIITEIGIDVNAWPTVKHFTSWLGLSPHNDKSGGKLLRSRTKKTQNRANLAFRLAAHSLTRSDTALGAFYRRMKARHGPAKATTATAHKLARIVYSMLKNRTAYADPGVTYYEEQYRDRAIRNLKRKAAALGLDLTLVPTQPMTVS